MSAGSPFVPGKAADLAFNNSLSSLKFIEQSPVDQQIIDNTLMSAVTASTDSTGVYVLDKRRLSLVVVASDTPSATITLKGGPDGSNFGAVATFANGDTTGATSQTISAAGTYVYTVPPGLAVKYVMASLTVTTGTFSVYLFGGAI